MSKLRLILMTGEAIETELEVVCFQGGEKDLLFGLRLNIPQYK